METAETPIHTLEEHREQQASPQSVLALGALESAIRQLKAQQPIARPQSIEAQPWELAVDVGGYN
jgi:hypothetical protein